MVFNDEQLSRRCEKDQVTIAIGQVGAVAPEGLQHGRIGSIRALEDAKHFMATQVVNSCDHACGR